MLKLEWCFKFYIFQISNTFLNLIDCRKNSPSLFILSKTLLFTTIVMKKTRTNLDCQWFSYCYKWSSNDHWDWPKKTLKWNSLAYDTSQSLDYLSRPTDIPPYEPLYSPEHDPLEGLIAQSRFWMLRDSGHHYIRFPEMVTLMRNRICCRLSKRHTHEWCKSFFRWKILKTAEKMDSLKLSD